MTNMKRITVAFPTDVDQAVLQLRKKDKYLRCTYSEIIRQLVTLGLDVEASKKAAQKQHS